MVYLAGIKDLNLLLVCTLAAGVVLAICWILVKLSVVCCCFCCCDVVVVVVVVGGGVFFIFLFCTIVLCVGFFAMTNVTFSALYVGFCIPLVGLCILLYFNKSLLFIKKKIQTYPRNLKRMVPYEVLAHANSSVPTQSSINWYDLPPSNFLSKLMFLSSYTIINPLNTQFQITN